MVCNIVPIILRLPEPPSEVPHHGKNPPVQRAQAAWIGAGNHPAGAQAPAQFVAGCIKFPFWFTTAFQNPGSMYSTIGSGTASQATPQGRRHKRAEVGFELAIKRLPARRHDH
jgi:hypothetical protein